MSEFATCILLPVLLLLWGGKVMKLWLIEFMLYFAIIDWGCSYQLCCTYLLNCMPNYIYYVGNEPTHISLGLHQLANAYWIYYSHAFLSFYEVMCIMGITFKILMGTNWRSYKNNNMIYNYRCRMQGFKFWIKIMYRLTIFTHII